MAAKVYKTVTLRMAFELAMRAAEGTNGRLEGKARGEASCLRQGELPILFTREEAVVAKSVLEEAFGKFIVNDSTYNVTVATDDKELPDTCKIRFLIRKK